MGRPDSSRQFFYYEIFDIDGEVENVPSFQADRCGFNSRSEVFFKYIRVLIKSVFLIGKVQYHESGATFHYSWLADDRTGKVDKIFFSILLSIF